jgi:transposase
MTWDAADASKTIVGIDPNMGNLLYCSTDDGKRTFRYTQNQRQHETKSKQFGYIRWKEKTSHIEDEKHGSRL